MSGIGLTRHTRKCWTCSHATSLRVLLSGCGAIYRVVMMQNRDWSGLQYAASQCWSLICSELIDRGADVTATDAVRFWVMSLPAGLYMSGRCIAFYAQVREHPASFGRMRT
jgi:hypothetical protein